MIGGKSEITEPGTFKIEYAWFPHPSIHFDCSNLNAEFSIDLTDQNQDIYLKLHSGSDTELVNASIATANPYGESGNKITGKVQDEIAQGNNQELSYLLFHVVNFQKFIGHCARTGENSCSTDRVSLETGDWKITLDQLKEISELEKQLNSKGGFAITHVGKIERTNGHFFPFEEVKEILEAFSDFLSFVRGLKVPLILFVGYKEGSTKVWEQWTQSPGDSWQSLISWCPSKCAKELAEIFPGFMKEWQEDREGLQLSIYWYTRIRSTPSLETTIILIQVALEKIATAKNCKKCRNASCNIRNLLNKYKIPIDFPWKIKVQQEEQPFSEFQQALETFKPPSPPPLQALKQASSQYNWNDGPHALVKVRNDIVHSRQDYPDFNPQVLDDVYYLGTWYLELVLLAIFGYEGDYFNRLAMCRETIPWANRHQNLISNLS